MKRIITNLGLGLLIVLVAAVLFTFLGPLFGWNVDTVISGSMEPILQVGSVVLSKPIKAEDIRIGDIITFYSPQDGKLTTHQVMHIENTAGLALQTKGVANEDIDPFVVKAQVVAGKVYFDIPYLGYAAQFLKSRLGLFVMLFLPACAIIAMEVKTIWLTVSGKEPKQRRIRKVT